MVAWGYTGTEPNVEQTTWWMTARGWFSSSEPVVAGGYQPSSSYHQAGIPQPSVGGPDLVGTPSAFVSFDDQDPTRYSVSSVDGDVWTTLPTRLPTGSVVSGLCEPTAPFRGGLVAFAFDPPYPSQERVLVPWLLTFSH